MVIINRQRLSDEYFYEEAIRLAEIKSQANGDAAVALLDDYDRNLLLSAVNAHAKKEGISISKIAKLISPLKYTEGLLVGFNVLEERGTNKAFERDFLKIIQGLRLPVPIPKTSRYITFPVLIAGFKLVNKFICMV